MLTSLSSLSTSIDLYILATLSPSAYNFIFVLPVAVLAEWKPPVYDNTKGITLVTATTRRNSPNVRHDYFPTLKTHVILSYTHVFSKMDVSIHPKLAVLTLYGPHRREYATNEK